MTTASGGAGAGGRGPDPAGSDARRDGDAAVLRAMQAGGGTRLLALRVVIVLVLLMAAQAYDGSLHALSHWIILCLYGLGSIGFGLAERRGGPSAEVFAWAGTVLNAGLAVYVIVEHMMAGGGTEAGADAVSRLPAFLLLLQTGLTMRAAHTLAFCAIVTASWVAAFVAGQIDPGLFPGPDTQPTAQAVGLATFVATGLLVLDGMTRLRGAVGQALRVEQERATLARFLPAAVAGDLARDEGGGMRRRHACLMVLDIRGFSALSREHPPEAMVAALLAVRAAAQAAVAEHGGLVDKYVGDAVLVQFVVGTPDAQARAALACAAAIGERIAGLNARRAAEGLFTIRAVVALHAGSLLVGIFDDGVRAEYTVLGPAMNALSRLEARAKAADLEIAASGDFLSLLGGRMPEGFCARAVGTAAAGQPALHAIETRTDPGRAARVTPERPPPAAAACGADRDRAGATAVGTSIPDPVRRP